MNRFKAINAGWNPTDESGEATDKREIVKVALMAFCAEKKLKDMTSFDVINGAVQVRPGTRLLSSENAHINAFRAKHEGLEVRVVRHSY